MSEHVIYSCIFGGRDRLHEPACEIPPGVRMVVFTDDEMLRSERWEIVHVPFHHNPRFLARRFKLLSHEIFPDAAATLWLDALFTLRNLGDVFDWPHQFALHPHPRRTCVFEEIIAVKRNRQDDPATLRRVEARYEAEGFPIHHGLWMSGVLFRRHTPAVKQFNEQWWAELSENSIRDQISLPYLLWKTGLEFETVPRGVPSVHWGNHRQ